MNKCKKNIEANLKYSIYSLYGSEYPDTLQYMNPSMSLEEIQNALKYSQIYKNKVQSALNSGGGSTKPTKSKEEIQAEQ